MSSETDNSKKLLYPVYEIIRPTCYCLKEFPDLMHSFQGREDFETDFAKRYGLDEKFIDIGFPEKDAKKVYDKYPACCKIALISGYYHSISKETITIEATTVENKLNRKLPHSLPGPLKQRKQVYWVV